MFDKDLNAVISRVHENDKIFEKSQNEQFKHTNRMYNDIEKIKT